MDTTTGQAIEKYDKPSRGRLKLHYCTQLLDMARAESSQVNDLNYQESRLVDILSLLIECGQVEAAKDILAALTVPSHRAMGHCSLAWQIAKTGLGEPARKLYSEALKFSRQIEEPTTRNSVFVSIAEEASELHYLDIAKEALENISGGVSRASALLAIASSEVISDNVISANEHLEKAIEASKKAKPEQKVASYLMIGTYLKEQSRISDALKFGRLAQEAAARIISGSKRVEQWLSIAVLQREWGDLDGAEISVLSAIIAASKCPNTERDWKFWSIAWNQAEWGNIQAAIETAERCEDKGIRSRVYKAIAEKLLNAGDVEAAVRTIKLANSFEDLASVQIAARDFAGAESTLRMINDPSTLVSLMCELVRAHTACDDASTAMLVTTEALAIVAVMDEPSDSAFANVVECLVMAAQIEAAWRIIHHLTCKYSLCRSFKALCEKAEKDGSLELARDYVKMIPLTSERREMCVLLVRTFLDIGDINEAIQTILIMEQRRERIRIAIDTVRMLTRQIDGSDLRHRVKEGWLDNG